MQSFMPGTKKTALLVSCHPAHPHQECHHGEAQGALKPRVKKIALSLLSLFPRPVTEPSFWAQMVSERRFKINQ